VTTQRADYHYLIKYQSCAIQTLIQRHMLSKPSVQMMKNVTSKKWFWIDQPDSPTYRQVHCMWFVIWLSLLSTLWQNIYYYISLKSLSSLARNYTVFLRRIRNAPAIKENIYNRRQFFFVRNRWIKKFFENIYTIRKTQRKFLSLMNIKRIYGRAETKQLHQ